METIQCKTTKWGPVKVRKEKKTKLGFTNVSLKGFCQEQPAACGSFHCYFSWSADNIYIPKLWTLKTNNGKSLCSCFFYIFNHLQALLHLLSFCMGKMFSLWTFFNHRTCRLNRHSFSKFSDFIFIILLPRATRAWHIGAPIGEVAVKWVARHWTLRIPRAADPLGRGVAGLPLAKPLSIRTHEVIVMENFRRYGNRE